MPPYAKRPRSTDQELVDRAEQEYFAISACELCGARECECGTELEDDEDEEELASMKPLQEWKAEEREIEKLQEQLALKVAEVAKLRKQLHADGHEETCVV